MRPLVKLWIIFSLVLAGCAGIDRPDTDLCVVNVPAQYQICFNVKRDYDKNGNLKSDAKPTYKPAVTIDDLNKNICTDPDGFAALKAYIQELRRASEGTRH